MDEPALVHDELANCEAQKDKLYLLLHEVTKERDALGAKIDALNERINKLEGMLSLLALEKRVKVLEGQHWEYPNG
jgi:predicted  nucleic acid-binding Zn-ribbon protein